jgi:hypothetical protein
VPEAKPLPFDAAGRAILSAWRVLNRLNNATMDTVAHEGKRQTLHIGASGTGECISSWRNLVLLEPGQYRLEALVSTTGVVPLKDKKGEGAGLRISGGLSLIGAVVAEIAAGSAGAGSGLAYRIAESGYRLNIPRMFAALLLLSAAGIVIYALLALVSHLVLRRWHESALGKES